MRFRQETRGAALIVAIAVMTVLLAITLTFFTASRIELRTSTNIENTVRADLLADAATTLAIDYLNTDLLEHPDATSTDHAWTTFFNGAWVAGKAWAFPGQPSLWEEGIPRLFYHGGDALIDGNVVSVPGVKDIPHLFVPRWEPTFVSDPLANADAEKAYTDRKEHPFVINPEEELPAVTIGRWADVDNDGDGYRDSVWVPLVADITLAYGPDGEPAGPGAWLADGVDNDLNGEIDESGERAVFIYNPSRAGLGDDAWVMTAPIVAPDGTFPPLRNVPVTVNWGDMRDNDYNLIADKHAEYFTVRYTQETEQDLLSFVDIEGNVVPVNADSPLEHFEAVRAKPVYLQHLQYVAELRKVFPNANILPLLDFIRLAGVPEIHRNYLPDRFPNNWIRESSLIFPDITERFGWRVKSTGEPVCEIIGRAAILIRDEASKVNLNVAGGHTFDIVQANRLADPRKSLPDNIKDIALAPRESYVWNRSIQNGATVHEYRTEVLPWFGYDSNDLNAPGIGRARKLWNLLMGAPYGSLARPPLPNAGDPFPPTVGSILDDASDDQRHAAYVLDAFTPGYGLVDDNGNCLFLAMNGIDDNGNGLIDEGLNTGRNLTPEAIQGALNYAAARGADISALETDAARAAFAAGVYEQHLGYFEGIDEPGEFQWRNPYRNLVAEGVVPREDNPDSDNLDNDRNGATNEVGELGDRVLRTLEEAKRIVRNEFYEGADATRVTNAESFVGAFGNLVTLHSMDRNARFRQAAPNVKTGPVELPGPARVRQGLRLDYNYARPEQIAQALREDWGLSESTFALVVTPDGSEFASIDDFVQNQGVDALVNILNRPADRAALEKNAFGNGLFQEGVSVLGGPFLDPFPADPQLRALQLGVQIADQRDTDYGRTQATYNVNDDWWLFQEFANRVEVDGEAPANALADAERRPISYTVSGFEGIRITEMMVRPVRRIEAEAVNSNLLRDPSDLNYYDNIRYDGNVFYRKHKDESFFLPEFDFARPPYDPRPAYPLNYEVLMMQKLVEEYGLPLVPSAPAEFWMIISPVDAHMGSTSVLATDQVAVVTDPDPEPGPLVAFPNIAEFVFGPGPGLPPGRYYLTFNMMRPGGTPTVTSAEQIRIATKYVSQSGNEVAIPPDVSGSLTIWPGVTSIIQDVYDFVYTVGLDPHDAIASWQQPILADSDPAARQPAGWAFVQPGDCHFFDDPASPTDPPDPHNIGYLPDADVAGRPTYTVTIPPYAAVPADQIYLHVAICINPGSEASFNADNPLAINFFDFSQEPDHEWVEIENVSGQAVDISGWQLVVGGVDAEGAVVTQDQVTMVVPDGTVIGYEYDPSNGLPINNRLILGVGKLDYVDHASPPPEAVDNLFNRNGIGLWSGVHETLGSFATVTTPPIPMRSPVGPGLDGRGLPLTNAVSVFETPSNSDDYARIVPLQVTGLTGASDVYSPGDIAKWVLRGGVFPNYPEHDGVDNDNDDRILTRDRVDHRGDGSVEAYVPGKGIDEGRYRMDLNLPVPGFFAGSPIQYNTAFFDNYLYIDDLENYPARYGFLGLPTQPPEWKELIERRFFPGDNVVVSLFQGDKSHKRVVDRVTYTERDVINRAIDDILWVPVGDDGKPLIPTLFGGGQGDEGLIYYPGFWPNNTMLLDFYRTLERKHSAFYNGDRFGTSNRWEATDGNYDDWSHDPVVAPDSVAAESRLLWQQLRWNGTPLGWNAAYALQGQDLVAPSEPDAQELLRGQARAGLRNEPLMSVGDVRTTPYFSVVKEFQWGATGYTGLEHPDSVLLGKPLEEPKEDAPGPLDNIRKALQKDTPALIDLGMFDPLMLSPARAQFRALVPADVESSDGRDDRDPRLTWTPIPRAWRPLFLYSLGEEFPLTVPYYGPDQGVQLPNDGRDDGRDFLFDMGFYTRTVLPGNAIPEDLRLLDRWPLERRAMAYVCSNSADPQPEDRGNNANIAEALFTWDADSGLEDGEYDLYIDTGASLDEALRALRAKEDENGTGRKILGKAGRMLTADAVRTYPTDVVFDVEAFTDRDADGRCWTDANSDRVVQPVELNSAESLGLRTALAAGSDGMIYYGTVSIRNNYLGVFLRNWSGKDRVARFAGVVLTPRPRTPGRINLNTAETRCYWDRLDRRTGEDTYKYFNPLMGVPGVLYGYNPVNGAFGYTLDSTTPPDGPTPDPTDPRPFLRWPFLWLLPTWETNNNQQAPQQALLARARMIELRRPEHWDGRYYRFMSDLAMGSRDYEDLTGREYKLFPLTRVAPTDADAAEAASAETSWRFSRVANLVTTRSDVFEILVTVQAGFGIDMNGDGVIDYRTDDEFRVTAEKRTRTVYER